MTTNTTTDLSTARSRIFDAVGEVSHWYNVFIGRLEAADDMINVECFATVGDLEQVADRGSGEWDVDVAHGGSAEYNVPAGWGLVTMTPAQAQAALDAHNAK